MAAKQLADSARVRKMLDSKPDELKQPLELIREGPATVTDSRDGKKHDAYLFLFHSFLYITKEVKAKQKYKMILAVRLRSTLTVSGDDDEVFSGTGMLLCGKATFFITGPEPDATLAWIRDLRACIAGEHDPDRPRVVFKEVDGERLWDVRAGLKSEQIAMLDKMHEELDNRPVELDAYLREWCDDSCLVRFLRARSWAFGPAMELLKSTLLWRERVRPDKITLEDVEHAGSSGDLYISPGRDKWGRIVVYMRPGRAKDTPEIRAQFVRYMAWLMETGSKLLDTKHTGVGKMLWIIDFSGCKITGSADENVKIAKETIEVMQDYYPERLYKGFVLNPPLPFFVLWKFVSSFLDPITKKKVNFIRKTKDHKLLLEYIEVAQLEQDYGGQLPPFDAAAWKEQFFSS